MTNLNQVRTIKEEGGVIISPFCSCKCLFCQSFPKSSANEIKKQKINALKNLLEFKRKGIRRIEISGGDPIEYDEICDLIKYIRKMNFEFVQLSTHGMRLNDDKFFKKFNKFRTD